MLVNNSVLAYYGSLKSDLLSVASGGAATTISQTFVQNGGVVFGVRYTKDFKGSEYWYARNEEELNQFKGSKYISSNKSIVYCGEKHSVYEIVASFLIEGKDVLFIGLGCDIYALKSTLSQRKVNDKHLFTIDLICHGVTFPYIQASVIEDLERKYNSKVINFSVKNKDRGWQIPSMYVEFANGKKYSKPFYDTDFGYAFDHYSKSGCWECKFKGDNHLADLTIGDHWGITEKQNGYNANGVSVLISRSEKGKVLIDSIDENKFSLFQCELEDIIVDNKMYYCSRVPDKNHEMFYEDFRKRGLHFAVRKHRGVIKNLLMPVKRSFSRMMRPSTKRAIKRYLESL